MLVFAVHYMGGGIKSHQDTVVHPMYVSYNSLPTNGGSLMRSNQTKPATLFRPKREVRAPVTLTSSGLECHKNFVNFNGKDNLLQTNADGHGVMSKSCNLINSSSMNDGFDTRGSQPRLMIGNRQMASPATKVMVNPLEMGEQQTLRYQDLMATQQQRQNQRKSMIDGDVSFYTGSEPVDDLIDFQPPPPSQHIMSMSHHEMSFNNNHNNEDGRHRIHQHMRHATEEEEEEELPEYNSFNRANILVNQKMKNGSFYKMPADFIPRSPNLSYRRRNQNAAKNMNFCDQIRSPPPHHPAMMHLPSTTTSSRDSYQPQRTRSHTQLPVQSSNSISSRNGLAGQGNVPLELRDRQGVGVPPPIVDRDYSPVAGGQDDVGGDVDEIKFKMNQLMRQKKSLRPRSYCSSNYYHEFDTTALSSPQQPGYLMHQQQHQPPINQ